MGALNKTVAALWRLVNPAPRAGGVIQAQGYGPAWGKGGRSYAAAKSDRLTADWFASAYSANAEVRQDLRKLRYRSRQQARDNHYIRKWLATLGRNVIGPSGIRLRSMAVTASGAEDKVARKRLAESFSEWSECGICTVDGQLSWVDAQRLILRAVSNDGDVLVRHIRGRDAGNRWGYAIQLMESDHLAEDDTFRSLPGGRSLFMGVETDRFRRPVAFHLNDVHPGEDSISLGGGLNRTVAVPARDILMPYMVDRPGQTRGVPWAHAAMLRLNDVGRYEEAEIVAARIAASKMGFFTSGTGAEYVPDAKEGTEGDEELISEASPGQFDQLPTGVDFKPWDPQHPTTAFEPFMGAMLHGVSSGLDISYAELTGDLKGVNFSSIRQGALSDRDAWRMVQGWTIGRVMRPVYREWLLMSLTTQEVKFPLARYDELVKAQWRGRGWSWVDPQKEVTAQEKAVDLRTDSRTNAAAASGREIEHVFEEIAAEEALAEEMGISLTRPSNTPASAPGAAPPDPGEPEEDPDEPEDPDNEEDEDNV